MSNKQSVKNKFIILTLKTMHISHNQIQLKMQTYAEKRATIYLQLFSKHYSVKINVNV